MASTVYQRVASSSASETPGHAHAARSGIWVAIFAITMSFAALTSSLMVRQGSGDWKHIALPAVIYLNTVALLLSSLTLEMGRRRADYGSMSRRRDSLLWLIATLALGMVFVAGQYLVWQRLREQGLYLATTSNSSFFYVFTAVHVLHVLGGITALSVLIAGSASRQRVFRRSRFEATAIYWHFMGALWVYLLIVISVRL